MFQMFQSPPRPSLGCGLPSVRPGSQDCRPAGRQLVNDQQFRWDFSDHLGHLQLVVSTYDIAPAARLQQHKHPFERYAYVIQGDFSSGPFSSPICDGRFGIPAGGNV